jgi:hypothetical protein
MTDNPDNRAGADEPPSRPPAGFKPPYGPGRCLECRWHVATQGHAPDCPANKWKRPR